MTYLGTGDLCEVIKASPNTLQGWIQLGVIHPVEGGHGFGSHRRYTVMQAVGLAVGVTLLRSERSCSLDYVGSVVRAFERITEEALVAYFNEGRTHFVGLHQGRLWMQEKGYGGDDAEKVYRDVKRTIAKIQRTMKPSKAGRRRGLVAAK